jgi:hypothetical protein
MYLDNGDIEKFFIVGSVNETLESANKKQSQVRNKSVNLSL